jgi:hypothetical protein
VGGGGAGGETIQNSELKITIRVGICTLRLGRFSFGYFKKLYQLKGLRLFETELAR